MALTRRRFLLLAPALAAAMPVSRARDGSGTLAVWAGQPMQNGHEDGPGTRAAFFDPRGLARDPHTGDIVVADAANALIRRVNLHGEVTPLAGAATRRTSRDGAAADARFVGPDAVAVGDDGTIFVADSYANTIRVLRDGTVSTLAGRAGEPGYADGRGTAAAFNHPVGLAVDPGSGDLLVADAYNNTLRRIDRDGRVRTIGGAAGVADHRDGPLASALFNTPVGLAVGPDGTIWVSEYFNHDVRRIGIDGMVRTVAGAADAAGDVDGKGAAARFRKPQQICVDADGNVIIADGGNHKVRWMTPDGEVRTLAGQGLLDRFEFGPLPGSLVTPYGVAPGPGGSVIVSSAQALLRIDRPD